MTELVGVTDSVGKIMIGNGEGYFLSARVESTVATAVESRPNLGRVIVATQDVAVGSLVIREAPILVWESDNWLDFLSKYKSLGETDQCGILDMYHPPLAAPTIYTHDLAKSMGIEIQLVNKLITICNTNAHEYYGRCTEGFSEVETFTPFARLHSGKSALFLYGSKVAHSCHPNVAYTSRTTDGKLEYRVIYPISSGDMIAFSYLDEVWETPTHVRRAQLVATKSFTCRCPRCMGQDYARPFHCMACKGNILCTDDKESEPTWTCSGCGPCLDMSRYLMTEKEVEIELDEWEQRFTLNMAQWVPDSFKNKVMQVSTKLHPHHYLAIRAMKMFVKLCASHAMQMEQLSSLGFPPHIASVIKKRFGSPAKLRMEAATMGLSIALILECIGANCCGDHTSADGGNAIHEEQHEAMTIVFHAAQDLMKCPRSTWPANAQAMVHRYIPAMRYKFGDSDEDVHRIEQSIPAPVNEMRTKPTHPALTKTAASIGSTKKKRKGGSTKKKKGRRK